MQALLFCIDCTVPLDILYIINRNHLWTLHNKSVILLRQSLKQRQRTLDGLGFHTVRNSHMTGGTEIRTRNCLLYTSDAADEL